MITQANSLTKQHAYQLIDQFPAEKLPEISLFLEQLHKVVNTSSEEHPWLKFAGMFADDPDWKEYQAAIAENRSEIDARVGVL